MACVTQLYSGLSVSQSANLCNFCQLFFGVQHYHHDDNGVFAAAVVTFSPLSDSDSKKRVEAGDAVVLYCEVSHAFAKVSWFKDGVALQASNDLNIQADGNMRRIVIPVADASHAGVYTCQTPGGDVITFNVDIAGVLLCCSEMCFCFLIVSTHSLLMLSFVNFSNVLNPYFLISRSPCGV